MPVPTKLREGSRLYREAAAKEITPYLKRRLAEQALSFAQLAERIEREEAQREAQRIERDKAAS